MGSAQKTVRAELDDIRSKAQKIAGGEGEGMIDKVVKSAVIEGPYRYSLSRVWEYDGKPVVFIMLNPSTADSTKDDPTIRRCMSFARAWGHGGIIVVNLFALRATNPKKLKTHANPVGPRNDSKIFEPCFVSEGPIVCAWGQHGGFMDRDKHVLKLLKGSRMKTYRIGPTTKGGHPRHPLYLRGDLALESHP